MWTTCCYPEWSECPQAHGRQPQAFARYVFYIIIYPSIIYGYAGWFVLQICLDKISLTVKIEEVQTLDSCSQHVLVVEHYGETHL